VNEPFLKNVSKKNSETFRESSKQLAGRLQLFIKHIVIVSCR